MRYIDFTIEGRTTDIDVHLEEQSDGSVLMTLDADGTPIDIRGLFFDVNDASLIPGLSISGPNVTGFEARNEAVMDLGHGVNMQGAGRGPFDVGVSFGSAGRGHDLVTSTSVVLSSSAGDLTLDQLALVDFGVRLQGGGADPKIVVTAPAAPDAIDDSLGAVEDTQIIYDVLGNDTDADGIADFRITGVTDPDHGTAIISDDGRYIIYTPDHDYSGADGFGYTMVDGHGGGDNAVATIAVAAVADAPTLSVTTAAGDTVNQIEFTVSAAVTDTDGSESIDRFEFSGLPGGASIIGESDLVYSPGASGQTLTQTFTLQLAPNSDFDFDLGVTAVSREASNGSEARTSQDVAVLVDANHNDFSLNFLATDQSIWNAGDAFMLIDDRFLGFTLDPPRSTSGGFVDGYADLYIRSGLQSTLTFDGGSIDASAPWDVDIDTTYNHTTDVMMIESMADLLSGGVSFTTSGPAGSYILDFIFDYAISAGLELDFGDLGSPDIFDFSASDNTSTNIINFSSDDLSYTFDLGFGISITIAWPDIDTTSLVNTSGSDFSSSGESNNFLEVGVDADQLLADLLLDGVNPFDLGIDIEVASGNVELLDVDLSAGANFLQDFMMALGNLDASLEFENGTSMDWDFSDVVLDHASSYDADGDGVIEFDLSLDQQADLTNETDLGFNVGYNIALLQASGSYDFLLDSGSWSVGPVWSTGDNFDLGSINLFDSTFDLDFASQTISFVGNEHSIV